ncbi:hypothetical protein PV326_010602 [Microctonus aethiopoides]|nr:hypothetical protein PV326_010602 [Microctonus aethiopoides]
MGTENRVKESKVVSKVNADNNDEYDSFAARNSTQKNSDFTVFMHLLKASIGSGILFLPHAFSRAGYVSALMCSIVIGLISCHTAILTVQCSQILCKRIQKPSMDLAEIASTSFKFGPEKIRKYAVSLNVVTNILVCFIQYETAIIYSLYVASSTQQLLEYFFNLQLNIRIYVIIFLPIYCLLALIPNFKYLVPFSILGALLLGLGFSITLYYLFIDFPSPGRLDMYTDMLSIPIYGSIFLFAVHNMTMIMPLENSMKNPQNMPRILATSMIFNMFIYMSFGFFGYNKYPNTCDTIIKNLPINQIIAQIVKIVVTLSIICSYGLHYYVPVNILWPMISRKITRRHYLYEVIFRLGGVITTTIIAAAIPQMTPLLGLLTAICMTTMMLLLPATIELMTKWYDKDSLPLFYYRWTKDILIIIVWLIMLVFGVSENLKDIIEAYGDTKNVNSTNSC